jgi:hypothetical protein
MVDWLPEVAFISPERRAVLDLIRLCKREMAYHRASVQVLQALGQHTYSTLATKIVAAIRSEAVSQEESDVIFRSVEPDLARGRDYASGLQEILSRYLR